ncbi:hypothetical protein RDI58_027630 [Solanum bulbocastanum]|uniref:Uncharacterized protein n=1 Tax=Solanum bulbocastanum TaxID=147425 RepID=A0AAN8SZ74_SOLBU
MEKLRKTESEYRMKLKQNPFSDQCRTISSEFSFNWGFEKLCISFMEFGYNMITTRRKKEEHQFFQFFMVWFRWVEIRKNTVTSGEFSRRHVSSGEEVLFFDFRNIEKDWETLAVEQNNYIRDEMWSILMEIVGEEKEEEEKKM